MAINRVSYPTTPNPVSGDWAKLVNIVTKSFQNINDPLQVDGSNIPQGATFQVGGVVYYADADTAITGTASDYVKLTPSSDGSTLDAAFVSSLSGVTWNKVWNGYYDTGGNLYLFDEFLAYSSGEVSSLETKAGILALNNRGKADITLSNYDNDSAPVVKSGSVFDNRGKLINITTDESPTGYSGIAVSTTFYLYFDESATAFIYDSTAPTWSDDLQGWYNGNDRALFSMYKDSGGTLYQKKSFLINQSDGQIYDLTVNNDLTLDQRLDTSMTIPADSVAIIPKGLYVTNATNSYVRYLIIMNGTNYFRQFDDLSGIFYSDGINYKFYNTNADPETIYYVKIG